MFCVLVFSRGQKWWDYFKTILCEITGIITLLKKLDLRRRVIVFTAQLFICIYVNVFFRQKHGGICHQNVLNRGICLQKAALLEIEIERILPLLKIG